MAGYLMGERKIPINENYDVIVVGGGPAGCAAAIAAAREGKSTLLIEATGSLGGMGTMGLVPAWCPFSDGEKIIYTGIAQEIFEKSKEGLKHVSKSHLNWVPINPGKLKLVYDELVIQSGAKVLFNTVLSCVEMENENEIAAIIVTNKAGLSAYKAKVYIDCTGDGDVAAGAGAEFLMGDEETKELQPATHCFSLSNVDMYAYQYGPRLHPNNDDSPIYDILKSGKYPKISDKHMCNNIVGPGTIGFNASHVFDVDNTDPISVSQALIKGRQIADEICRALAEYVPEAFANAFVSQTAPLMGIRETRRIVGDYILTRDDYINRRSFEDEIGRNSYYLDVHRKVTDKLKKSSETDVDKRAARYNSGESHGIPYRCLTPNGLSNLLVAGRPISCDREIFGSVRVMPVCLVTGQAAGTAAALSCNQEKRDVHNIDVKLLRQTLRNNGAYFL